MSKIRVEALDKEYIIEYDRDSMIKMEEMGFNALNPTEKMFTNMEIMIYGGLLKHQPKTTWKEAIAISEALRADYEMQDLLEAINPMIEEVFFPGGTKKKKKIKVEKA